MRRYFHKLLHRLDTFRYRSRDRLLLVRVLQPYRRRFQILNLQQQAEHMLSERGAGHRVEHRAGRKVSTNDHRYILERRGHNLEQRGHNLEQRGDRLEQHSHSLHRPRNAAEDTVSNLHIQPGLLRLHRHRKHLGLGELREQLHHILLKHQLTIG